ncbi:Crp/Fnr family transcriptional regulator [Chryseobacterium foetidum]|uniref:Crp/Fnr family transcriptional regulator n=1 Tax=Chryseobacterium foetidum TaxID=2951057 RepID=UPI0021C692C7|nr:Crp/Fnr family transcriptional regulator [Chryseobacterium foetidum]
MVICEDLLFSHGAVTYSYDSGEYIFREGTISKFYFQIQEGIVKINNFHENGKEFIHGFPFKGHCFGESYLFTETPYGINAITVSKCDLIKIEKQKFLKLLLENPELFLKISNYTAERLHFRYLVSSFLSDNNPFIRITKLLDHIKKYFGYSEKYSFIVPYTRNQLASLTGLRVETVIRTIKKMEQDCRLEIKDNKIYYQLILGLHLFLI